MCSNVLLCVRSRREVLPAERKPALHPQQAGERGGDGARPVFVFCNVREHQPKVCVCVCVQGGKLEEVLLLERCEVMKLPDDDRRLAVSE